MKRLVAIVLSIGEPASRKVRGNGSFDGRE